MMPTDAMDGRAAPVGSALPALPVVPVVLHTERLVLDLPVPADRERVVEYCQDPLFERYLTLPWPYLDRHGESFLGVIVPDGWANGTEYTWALRLAEGGPLLGVIGHRLPASDIGFWLGAPHRGHGYMTEAMMAVAEWLFGVHAAADTADTARAADTADTARAATIAWECVVGNVASASVARKTGFRFTGEHPSAAHYRDGTHPNSWTGTLSARDLGIVQPGWPDLGEHRRDS